MRKHVRDAVATVAFALACITASQATAEIQLFGSTDDIVLRAKNATVAEFLSGLQSAFHVKISLIGSSTRRFTGVYSGSMRRVLSRLLDGTDYVIEPDADGLLVRIIGASAASHPVPLGTEPDDLAPGDLAVLTALASAAAGHEGSRASRIRQQRMMTHPAGPDPY